MNFGNVEEPRDAFHNFAHAPFALPIFRGSRAVLRRYLPVLGSQKFNSLRECLMPLRQPFKSLVNRLKILFSF